MINIAICDDEKPFQEKMRKIIALYMEQKEVEFSICTFGNGRDLLKYCADSDQKTIVFLDINMDEVDGIETATKIRELFSNIYIVFVTAYIKYSLDNCIIYSKPQFDENGCPPIMTNSMFQVFGASSPQGKIACQKYEQIWANSASMY